jgi:hypothetical protein
MESIAETIREIVSETKDQLMAISSEHARQKPSADVWSKQEILGHLVDSAYNNHQRVVRTAMNMGADFPPYQQEQWVIIQAYNKRDWFTMIDLWVQVNLHLCSVIETLSDEALGNLCNIGKDQPVPLRLVINDYLRHLKMHLEDIQKS